MEEEIQQIKDDNQRLTQDVASLHNELQFLRTSNVQLREPIDIYTKQAIKNVITDTLPDILWDNVFHIASFTTNSLTTTTSELFDTSAASQAARESDTTGGKIFLPSINSKFKTAFYLGAGISKSTVWLMAPAVSTLTTVGTSIIDANKSGVGIKIVHGVVSAMSSVLGTVTLLPTGITITDDTTHVLEIQYYISHAIIKFNNVVVGDISCNLRPNTAFGTFFPFLTSIGSDDGTSVNITLERYEFLQRRK